MSDYQPRIDMFYKESAKACCGTLDCRKCGRTVSVSEVQANEYLRHGWPVCCDGSMSLTTEWEKP